MKKQQIKIVAGRLYDWRGNIVRAGKPTNNGLRHVRIHNLLHGWVRDSELNVINRNAVYRYLALADV